MRWYAEKDAEVFKALFFSAVGVYIIFYPSVANATLMAAYSFNEGVGATVTDVSGMGIRARLRGGLDDGRIIRERLVFQRI